MTYRNSITPENILIFGGNREERMTKGFESFLQKAEGSVVVTDRGGELYKKYADDFENRGYIVKKIDFANSANSEGFSLFKGLLKYDDERDTVDGICRIVESLYAAKKHELITSKEDEFIGNVAKMLLNAVVAYITFYCAEKYSDFYNVQILLEALEGDDNSKTPLDMIFETLEKEFPDSFAVKNFNMARHLSGESFRKAQYMAWKMIESLTDDEVGYILMNETDDLRMMRIEKTALFINTTPNSDNYNGLLNAITTELLYKLMLGMCEVPVQFFIDAFAPGVGIAQMSDVIERLNGENIAIVAAYPTLDCLREECDDADWFLREFELIEIVNEKEVPVNRKFRRDMEKSFRGSRAPKQTRERNAEYKRDFNNPYSYEIEKWVQRTSFNEFSREIHKRVKGQEQLDIILVNIYNYLENMARGHFHSNNILVAAPSGCGKTETYRALKEYFKKELFQMPFVQIDMTSITEEGYKGRDTKAVIEPLETEYGTGGIGIIFLDEFDKKLIPSYNSNGGDVNKAVQSQLLTTIEGIEYPEYNVDTNLTMFIGLGAFDPCREKKAQVEKHIGFGNGNIEGQDYYADITREDMIDLGASYELIGRFGTVVNYHKLTDRVVSEIIDGMVKGIGVSIDMELKITDEFRQKLIENANGKFGCRLIHSILNDAVMNAYLDILKKGKKDRDRVLEITGDKTYRMIEHQEKRTVQQPKKINAFA